MAANAVTVLKASGPTSKQPVPLSPYELSHFSQLSSQLRTMGLQSADPQPGVEARDVAATMVTRSVG